MRDSVTAWRIARSPLSDALEHALNGRFGVGLTGQEMTGELGVLQVEQRFESASFG